MLFSFSSLPLVKATLEIKASQLVLYQQPAAEFQVFYCLLKCDWKDETDFYANTIHFQRRRGLRRNGIQLKKSHSDNNINLVDGNPKGN